MNEEDKNILEHALSVMSGRVSPSQAEPEIFTGWIGRDEQEIREKCELIVLNAILSAHGPKEKTEDNKGKQHFYID